MGGRERHPFYGLQFLFFWNTFCVSLPVPSPLPVYYSNILLLRERVPKRPSPPTVDSDNFIFEIHVCAQKNRSSLSSQLTSNHSHSVVVGHKPSEGFHIDWVIEVKFCYFKFFWNKKFQNYENINYENIKFPNEYNDEIFFTISLFLCLSSRNLKVILCFVSLKIS